ncbi:MAG TPA: hypothetical protein VMG12_25160 [Polyangiaceae bacterium]|nr:hypothetical protein [Polyangiaceae bacterium]
MGFLSKLFGGDPAPGKPQDEAAASSAAAAPAPPASPEASPPDAAEAPKTVPRPGEASREAAPVARTATVPDAAPAPRTEFASPPKSTSTAALRAPADAAAAPAAQPPKRPDVSDAARAAARPTLKNTERQPAPAPLQPPPVAAPAATAPATTAPATTAPAPRRAPETPRRSPPLESSIITSAPELTAEPAKTAGAPRPGAATRPARAAAEAPRPPAAAADPNPPPRAPMSSVSGEPGLLGGARSRKDRTKSPGFYSNMAPAYGSQTVGSGLGQSALKRTVVGVAPPPEPLPTGGAAGAAKAPAEATPNVEQSAHVSDSNGAAAAAVLDPTALPEPLATAAANDVAASADAVAPAQAANESDEEKEDTSPGVGHMPSRHDPALRNEIPERDLELLVQFVMDLGFGIATDAWLAAAREAVVRLKVAAIGLARSALDKALSQLAVELDAPSALGEDRRGRIMQQLVLVDLALPRPMDVSGQRQLRERLIVQHLIAELAASHPLIAQRLREDGSISLDRLPRLVPSELAERVGLSLDQVEQALALFRDYLDERSRRGPAAAVLGKGQLLAQRLADLEASAELFESVADSDDAQAKREARRRRQSDIARVSLCLAEWGEAGLLGEFERSSVQGKIARLRRWLTELPAS